MQSQLLELLQIPEKEDLVFQRPPLILTICQIRFPPVLSVADGAFVAPFQRHIYKDYPITVQGTDIQVQLGFDTGKAEFQPGRQSAVWQFSDRNDNWKVVLAQDFLGIETRRYSHFEDFLKRLRRVLTALIKYIEPSIVTRIGLRYVNEVRVDNVAWASVIRQELLGPISEPQLKDHISHMVSELLLAFPHDEQIRVRHGLFPRGTTVQPIKGESVSEQPFYLLDFDAFREFPLSAGLLMQTDPICHLIEVYNKAVYRLFRWSVTETYTETLGGEVK